MPFAEIHNAIKILQTLPVYPQMANAICAASKTSAASFRTALEKDWRDTAKGWTDKEFPFTSIQPPEAGRRRAIDFYNLGRCTIS